jgi:hypothetical protein
MEFMGVAYSTNPFVPNIDFSTWDTNRAIYFIFITIAIMWVFPAMAYLIFRTFARKGEKKDPEEFPHTPQDGYSRL